MKFGDNLKQIRKSKKISQEELAEKLGVSRQSVSKWETGENFPSMQNIMCLCDIFKCKINDLVHEDFVDIDSLDKEIKMSVVKFKKEKQKNMKIISKFVYVLSKIAEIMTEVGIAVLVVLAILVPFICKNVTIDGFELKANNMVIGDVTNSDITVITDYLNNHNNTEIIIHAEIILISLIISLFLLRMIANYLYKLFKNINECDTPFTMDNASYIRKISLYVLLYIIIPYVLGVITQLIMGINLNAELELTSIIFGLIIFSISYIFEYGYQIQLDSKGKIYGDENE